MQHVVYLLIVGKVIIIKYKLKNVKLIHKFKYQLNIYYNKQYQNCNIYMVINNAYIINIIISINIIYQNQIYQFNKL